MVALEIQDLLDTLRASPDKISAAQQQHVYSPGTGACNTSSPSKTQRKSRNVQLKERTATMVLGEVSDALNHKSVCGRCSADGIRIALSMALGKAQPKRSIKASEVDKLDYVAAELRALVQRLPEPA